MQTPPIAIACVVVASILGALGQYLFKAGTERGGERALGFLATPWVWLGMACYIAVMLLFTYAFRKGGTVTVLYPVYASTFIWAAIMAYFLYGQPIRAVNILGMALLLVGMWFMGIGGGTTGG
jgi:multidrug transporter EmrE-like cation transporter